MAYDTCLTRDLLFGPKERHWQLSHVSALAVPWNRHPLSQSALGTVWLIQVPEPLSVAFRGHRHWHVLTTSQQQPPSGLALRRHARERPGQACIHRDHVFFGLTPSGLYLLSREKQRRMLNITFPQVRKNSDEGKDHSDVRT